MLNKQIEINWLAQQKKNLTRRTIEQVNGRVCRRCLNEIESFSLKHYRKQFFETGNCEQCQQELFWGDS